MRWIKRQAMVGPSFKRMGRSPEKSASITVTIQPSRLADGEFLQQPARPPSVFSLTICLTRICAASEDNHRATFRELRGVGYDGARLPTHHRNVSDDE